METEVNRVLDNNRRAFEGIVDLFSVLNKAGSIIGRAKSWIVFDAKLTNEVVGGDRWDLWNSVISCRLETHPEDPENWSTKFVFREGCGDGKYVFIDINTIETDLHFPYLEEIREALASIKPLTGAQLASLAMRKQELDERLTLGCSDLLENLVVTNVSAHH